MTSRRKRAAVIIVSLTLLAACSDDDNADPPSTSAQQTVTESTPTTNAPPTTASTTTTTEAPTTTSAPTTPPTTTQTTIAPDDWEGILEALSARRVALYAAPDLSRVNEYCAPESDCASRLETQLGDAIAKGQHVEGQRPFDVVEVVQASVGEQEPGAPAIAGILFIVAPTTPPPPRLVDANGNVVEELSLTTTPTRGRFTLVAWEDPTLPWRVVLAEDLGPVP